MSCFPSHVIILLRTVSVKFRLKGPKGGGPQVGEVTCGKLPHLTCKRDRIKMRDYIDRPVIPAKRVTSPTWGPPFPRKQALYSRAYERIIYKKTKG